MDLTSPGSCMEEFRAQPVIECHGHGTCNFYDGITSFWLTIIEDGEEFNQPKQQTLKADQTSKISRFVEDLYTNSTGSFSNDLPLQVHRLSSEGRIFASAFGRHNRGFRSATSRYRDSSQALLSATSSTTAQETGQTSGPITKPSILIEFY